MAVEIFTGLVAEILRHAEAAHPAEACGLLIGGGNRVHAIVPTANVAGNPQTGFEIDPASLLRTHRAAREAGQAVIGSYHSHPNGHPLPSARDTARVNGSGEIWLIAAQGGVRAFVSSATGFQSIELRGVDAATGDLR